MFQKKSPVGHSYFNSFWASPGLINLNEARSGIHSRVSEWKELRACSSRVPITESSQYCFEDLSWALIRKGGEGPNDPAIGKNRLSQM